MYDYKSINRLVNSRLPLVQGVVESAEEHRLRGKTNAPPDGHEYDYTFVAYTFRIERLWPTATSPFELPLHEGMVVNGAEGPGKLGRWTGRTPAPAPTQVGDRLLGFVGRNELEIVNEIARRPDPKVPVISFSGSGAIWLLEDRPDADSGKVRTYATNMFDTRSGPLEDVLARIDYERGLGFRPDRFSREVGG